MRRIRPATKNIATIVIALVLLAACAPLIDKPPKPVEGTSSSVLQPAIENMLAPSLLAEWKSGQIFDMAWSPSGKLFAINYSVDNSDNNFIQAFSAESLNSLWIAKDSLAWDLIFTSDGQFILESNTNAPYFYWRNVEKGDIVLQIGYEDVIPIDPGDCHGGGQIIMENASHNTALIASYSDLIGLNTQNMVVINLDLGTQKCKNLLKYQGSFDLFDSNSSGNLLAYGGEGKDDSIVIWDIEKQAEVCRIPQVEFGRFVPGENTLAVVRGQKMFFIEASTCREQRELNISPSVDYENYLAFSPDGKQFAIARDAIEIMNVSTGETLAQIPFPEKAMPITNKLFLSGIKFSPDSHYLLVAYGLLELNSADDGEVQLWQLKP